MDLYQDLSYLTLIKNKAVNKNVQTDHPEFTKYTVPTIKNKLYSIISIATNIIIPERKWLLL